jgi:hypothetical protein
MKKIIFLPVFLFLIFISCSKENDLETKKDETADNRKSGKDNGGNLSAAGFREGGVEFNVKYIEPRKIYKIIKEDINGNGNNEIIILSIAREDEYVSYDYYNFDMLEIFSLDEESKSYKKIVSDTVDYSKECIVESLDGSSNKQIIIKTYTGGNDLIVSSGMFVYGMISPLKIQQLKYIDSGDPQLSDLDDDKTIEILVSDEYRGVSPQLKGVVYVKDIFSFINNKFTRTNSDYPGFFERRITASSERYKDYKVKLLEGMEVKDFSYPVYTEAAEIILNNFTKGDQPGMMKFWNEEKDFLQINLSYDEFIDLKNLVTKLQPIAEEL